jgi:hypothetical protein
MLRSFRIGNYKSFADEQELLLMPAGKNAQPTVLPVAAIYGANASGKSNLLDGLRFMGDAVRRSYSGWDADAGVPRRPFLLQPEYVAKPTICVVEVVADDVPYTYGFGVDDERIHHEWLYSYPEGRKRILFERDSDRIKIGSTITDSRI